MQSTTSTANAGPRIARRKTIGGKLSREFGRLAYKVQVLAMRPRALTAPNQFLFILGHMRSGSTLLCHLLCNSDDIIGFGEAHNNYRRRSDLARLLMSVRKYTGTDPLQHRYVLDKIVGTRHIMHDSVLADLRTRYVFLVREPLAAIASIVAMRRSYHDETPQQLLAFAAAHYTDRLAQLTGLAETIDDSRRCLLLTHRQLLSDTPAVFAALETFLDLRAPLREDYQITSTTGTPGIGDPSPNIRLGKIVRSLPRKHVDVSPPLAARLEECYQSSLEKIQQSAQAVAAESPAVYRRAA